MAHGMTRQIFIQAGEPLAVMGAATQTMVRDGDALVVEPDARWGNPLFLFADAALEEADFRIHARLTLEALDGDGVSFLLGGFYHYPMSRPEGNRALRVSFARSSGKRSGSGAAVTAVGRCASAFCPMAARVRAACR